MCLTDPAAKHRLKVVSFPSTTALTNGDLFSANIGVGKIRCSFATSLKVWFIPWVIWCERVWVFWNTCNKMRADPETQCLNVMAKKETQNLIH